MNVTSAVPSPGDAFPDKADAESVLDTYRLGDGPLFVIGSFDRGITVFAQQVRALNLAWAFVSSGQLRCDTEGPTDRACRIAIVGGGFAGLTLAAALTKKGVDARITLLERRDTLLPLQQGSDSRWLHPHIYDWPKPGSESPSAALPLMTWTASRASDVVVQALSAWSEVWTTPRLQPWLKTTRIYCNARHVQVEPTSPPPGGAAVINVEWNGELRDTAAPANPAQEGRSATGNSEQFDVVVLAVGFGLERDAEPSYWRNETLAQPELGPGTGTYVVSGAGDGAMIDLFRLRIAQYRQDRILAELFDQHTALQAALRQLAEDADRPGTNLFHQLQRLWSDEAHRVQTAAVLDGLRKRLRNDTEVVLRVRPQRFSDLFTDDKRLSFQNRLLAFLLFKCGGFHPSTGEAADLSLVAEYGVADNHFLRRHGTTTKEVLRQVLPPDFHDTIDKAMQPTSTVRQDDIIRWRGGYFDHVGPVSAPTTADSVKGGWRKEYLPGTTQVLAASFCGSVVGYLTSNFASGTRLRVTFHRTLRIGPEQVLQQCCEYLGTDPDDDSGARAGRTFPANHATIGAAFGTRTVVRTKPGADKAHIDNDMQRLHLNDASREMAHQVRSILAIPIVGAPEATTRATGSGDPAGTVVGVLYADSYEADYFTDREMVTTLVSMTEQFAAQLTQLTTTPAGRVANFTFWGEQTATAPDRLGSLDGLETLETVTGLAPPNAPSLGQINFDFSDFRQVRP